ncbi:hypothetical protein FHR81_001830 [Actinoalloteichus hoggarensis]|uniref:Uncharacterized protein n=1 Tax=Actinoalloteichus hoggarensis TaxID=1470176 RepID=A0A221W4P3_9PSEU|nr:hypothetical protein AHOG_16170 [Actinoalloteichus hoggarensis]MBB5920792.1 hypothetical protein [Actinoalloteichus hoggarensis]
MTRHRRMTPEPHRRSPRAGPAGAACAGDRVEVALDVRDLAWAPRNTGVSGGLLGDVADGAAGPQDRTRGGDPLPGYAWDSRAA